MEDDSSYPLVRVVGAPGFEDFEGELILRLPGLDDRGSLGIVGVWGDDGNTDVQVVAMEYVFLVKED